MGRKQPWKGKYIYLYVASLTFLFLFDLGCATFVDRKPLLYSQMLIDRGDFEGAVEENRKVLSSYSNRPPGDEALFNLGLIYAHYGNPQKDYEKAIFFFRKLLNEHTKSPLVEQAKIWIGVLNVIEKSKHVDIEIEEMKKELSR